MKKTVYIFICLYFSILINGQTKLIGTYKESSEVGHTILKFSANNQFEYDASSDIKQWIGKGTFEVKHKQLLLHFSKADSTKNTHYTIKNGICNDSNFIKLNVKNLKNESQAFVSIIITDSRKKRYNSETNLQGESSINSTSFVFPIAIRVYFFGATNINITVKDKCCPNISVYLNIYGPEIVNSINESYKILQMDSAYLVLKQDDTLHLKKIN